MTEHSPRRRSGKDKPQKHAPAGLAARRIAIQAFEEVLGKGQPFEEVFDRHAFALPSNDRGLAHRIGITSLRRLGHLRLILDQRIERPLPEGLQRLHSCLVTGAAQILFMDVPDHAAVDCAVQLVQADSRTKGFAGLCNAVLRTIAREREAILPNLDPLKNLPDWLARRWSAAYGLDEARQMAAASLEEGSLDLTVKADAELWAQKLGAVLLPTGSLRLKDHGAIPALEGYEEGAWWVQDAAARIPAMLFSDLTGKVVADFCAAPGGKTVQLILAGGHVTAFDRSATRLRRLEVNLQRMKLAAEIIMADTTSLEARYDSTFDAILLDAPCSSTGTLRGHPDIAWLKSEADITSLARLQTRLLDRAVDCLKPGGELVYSTCSLEPEEGEAQIEALLKRRGDLRVDLSTLNTNPAFAGLLPETTACASSPRTGTTVIRCWVELTDFS